MEVSLTEDLDLLRIWLNRHPEYSGRVDAVCIEGALKYACSACRKCYAVGDLRKSGTADGVDGVTISPNIGSYVRHLKTISTSTDMHAGKIVTLVAEPGKRVRKVVDFATK